MITITVDRMDAAGQVAIVPETGTAGVVNGRRRIANERVENHGDILQRDRLVQHLTNSGEAMFCVCSCGSARLCPTLGC